MLGIVLGDLARGPLDAEHLAHDELVAGLGILAHHPLVVGVGDVLGPVVGDLAARLGGLERLVDPADPLLLDRHGVDRGDLELWSCGRAPSLGEPDRAECHGRDQRAARECDLPSLFPPMQVPRAMLARGGGVESGKRRAQRAAAARARAALHSLQDDEQARAHDQRRTGQHAQGRHVAPDGEAQQHRHRDAAVAEGRDEGELARAQRHDERGVAAGDAQGRQRAQADVGPGRAAPSRRPATVAAPDRVTQTPVSIATVPEPTAAGILRVTRSRATLSNGGAQGQQRGELPAAAGPATTSTPTKPTSTAAQRRGPDALAEEQRGARGEQERPGEVERVGVAQRQHGQGREEGEGDGDLARPRAASVNRSGRPMRRPSQGSSTSISAPRTRRARPSARRSARGC